MKIGQTHFLVEFVEKKLAHAFLSQIYFGSGCLFCAFFVWSGSGGPGGWRTCFCNKFILEAGCGFAHSLYGEGMIQIAVT